MLLCIVIPSHFFIFIKIVIKVLVTINILAYCLIMFLLIYNLLNYLVYRILDSLQFFSISRVLDRVMD